MILGRLVGFDVETTGVDPEEARIVTAALVVAGGGEPTELRTWLVNPGVPIPDEAAAIHGVTTERAEAEGVPAGDALPEVLAELAAAVERGWPIVAFNARYDLTVLDREAQRLGLAGPADWPALRVIDPLVMDKWLDRYRKGSRKLDAICAHHEASLDGAHDAGADAIAAARLAWRLCAHAHVERRPRNDAEYAELKALCDEWDAARESLDALHAAQERWAREQALGLAEHFARKGKPEYVEPAWPVVPARSPTTGGT